MEAERAATLEADIAVKLDRSVALDKTLQKK